MRDAESAGNRGGAVRVVARSVGGGCGDYLQAGIAGQRAANFLCQAVGQIGLIRVASKSPS